MSHTRLMLSLAKSPKRDLQDIFNEIKTKNYSAIKAKNIVKMLLNIFFEPCIQVLIIFFNSYNIALIIKTKLYNAI